MLYDMRFVIFILFGWGILFFMHCLVYLTIADAMNISWTYWYVITGALAFSYFIASILVRKFEGLLANVFYFAAATWLGVIFIIFSVLLPYEILHILTGFNSVLLVQILFGLAVGLSIYAIFNGRRLIIKELTIPIDKLTNVVKAVHLTDIHIGTVHQIKFLEEVVEKTNKLKPDVVYITGDLFDGSVPIDENILAPLNRLEAPAFFSNGNHEEYEGLKYVRETLSNIRVELLENRMIVHEGIQVVGVNDRQSLKKGQTLGSILENMHLNSNLPTVLMYHTPVEWHDARANGVDLMLSGHTHNGQIYPFTLLVKVFFKYIKGLYMEDGKYLHVSPGTGTWGPPMRLGSRNQITVLNLVPKI
jgi:predicted MPP superfamily phosphohydrolase